MIFFGAIVFFPVAQCSMAFFQIRTDPVAGNTLCNGFNENHSHDNVGGTGRCSSGALVRHPNKIWVHLWPQHVYATIWEKLGSISIRTNARCPILIFTWNQFSVRSKRSLLYGGKTEWYFQGTVRTCDGWYMVRRDVLHSIGPETFFNMDGFKSGENVGCAMCILFG